MSVNHNNGLNYFSFSVDFFNNPKIRSLKRVFGMNGIIVLIYLYAEIYKKEGYYLILDEFSYEMMLEDLYLSDEEAKEIFKFLFNKSYFTYKEIGEPNSFPILITSTSVQEQFQLMIKGSRKNQAVDPNVWILPANETLSHIKVTEYSRFDFINRSNEINKDTSSMLILESEMKSIGMQGQDESRRSMLQNTDEWAPKTGWEETANDNVDLENNKSKDSELSSPKFTSGQPSLTQVTQVQPHKSKVKYSKVNKSKLNNIYLYTSEAEIEITKKPNGDIRTKNNYKTNISKFYEKELYGELDNIWLTDEEVYKLQDLIGEDLEDYLMRLSNYKASAEKGYSSDYLAIRNWYRRDQKEQKQKNNVQTFTDYEKQFKQKKNGADSALDDLINGG